MNLAYFMPTTTGSAGRYNKKARPSTPVPTGRYAPSSSDFVTAFYAVLRRWQSETAFESNPAKIVGHPSFKALVGMADTVTPIIVKELLLSPSFLVWVLEEAYQERPYTKDQLGDIVAMSDAWVAWAESHGRAD